MRGDSSLGRGRIEAQGFLGLDDRTIQEVNFWLRLSPAICITWTAIGTALQSVPALWALAPFALLGALLPGHSFTHSASARCLAARRFHLTLSLDDSPAS